MHNTASHSRCIAGQSVCPQKQCFAAAMVLQVRSALLLQPATTTLVLIPAVLAALLCSGTELRCTGEQLADAALARLLRLARVARQLLYRYSYRITISSHFSGIPRGNTMSHRRDAVGHALQGPAARAALLRDARAVRRCLRGRW